MSADPANFHILSILDEDPVLVGAGSLQWVPVRRRLGIGAFGVNAFRAAEEGDAVVEDHIESPGQEELYIVITGRVRFTIADEQVDTAAGTAVFVARPEVRRSGIALENGTTVVAVGGWRGESYHSLPWEPIYLAQEAMLRGDWAEAAEVLEREAGDHRDTAIVQFRLACCHAQMGELDRAAAEVRHARGEPGHARPRSERRTTVAATRPRRMGRRNRRPWLGLKALYRARRVASRSPRSVR